MKSLASPKKLLATLLSLVMVCTMLQCVLFTASASEETIDTLIAAVNADSTVTLDEADEINKISVMYDALADQSAYTTTVSDLKNDLFELISKNFTTFSAKTDFTQDNWSVVSYADKVGTFKFGGTGSPELRVGIKTSVALDGLQLLLNRLHQTETASKSGFSVLFAPKLNDTFSAKFNDSSFTGLLLYFDLINGQIIANIRKTSGGAVTIGNLVSDTAVMEKLKLSYLENKVFAIGMNATSDAENPYQLSITIAGETSPVVVNIPAEYYDASAIAVDGKTYVSFTRGYYLTASTFPSGTVNTKFDFVGYRNTKYVSAAINTVKAATDIETTAVKESDAQAIYNARVAYETLAVVDDADGTKLAALEAALLELSTNGYELPTAFGSSTSIITNLSTYKNDKYARFFFNGASLSPGLRVGPTSSVVFDGMELKFANLFNTKGNNTHTGIGIQFLTTANGDFVNWATEGILLFIDVVGGNIYLNQKDRLSNNADGYTHYISCEKVIENSDVIKALERTVFTLGVNKKDDGKYKVTINAAGVGSVYGEMTVAENLFLSNGKTFYSFNRGRYSESYYCTTTTGNVTIKCPTGSQYNQFDFLGYTNTAGFQEAAALISALPTADAVTTNDGNVIFEAEEVYNALTDYEKTRVDGDKLSAVRAKYDALFTAETSELGYTVISDSILASNTTTLNSWWGGEGKFNATAGVDGVCMTWVNNGIRNRLPVSPTINMDGLSLRFNNFKQTGGSVAEFAVLFSQKSANDYATSGNPLFAVVLNATNGTLKVYTRYSTDTSTYYDVIANDLLKYENIAGGKFTLDFAEAGEGEYSVTVTVGGKSVSGYIPAAAFDDVADSNYPNANTNPNNCHFAVAPFTSGTYQQLDVVGYKSEGTVEKSKIDGAALTISDGISVDYKVNKAVLDNNNLKDPYITFALSEDTLNVDGVLNANGMYDFKFPEIAPNLMGETIYATLFAYDASDRLIQVTSRTEYSVKQYCYSMLEKYPNDEELCDLIVDLLRYGAASQGYTNKTENGLVTDALTDAQKAFGTAYTAATAGKVTLGADASYNSANKQVTWKSASLFLADVVNIRFKFTVADGVDVNALTVKATVGGNEVAVSADRIEQINDSSSYYLYFDGATAARMRDAVAITFYNGDTAVSKTVNYSIENYIGTQVDKNEDESLVSMLKALLCYGDSAAAYASK